MGLVKGDTRSLDYSSRGDNGKENGILIVYLLGL